MLENGKEANKITGFDMNKVCGEQMLPNKNIKNYKNGST